MKAQSDVRPDTIQKLDSKTYVYNYNIEEVAETTEEGTSTHYEYDQVTISGTAIDQDDVIKDTILANWDLDQQLKLINDYFAYSLGIETDEKYKTNYEEFLALRSSLRSAIVNSVA